MSNVELNPGTGGATLGTDQVAGVPNVDYQVVKLGFSASGTTPTQVSTAAPLPIGDAGGSLTVDGTVAVSGTVAVTDNASSLTVDAPVGTPVFVRLSDGAAAISALPITDNAGSLTVDGTVGVSGTVTVDSELTTADLDTGAGTDTRAVVGLVYGSSGGGVLVSTTNPLPISDGAGSLTVDGTVSITANSSVNVAQLAGTTTDTNSGNKSAGTLRVVLATDQPALTNKLLVTPDSVALPANQSVNVSQINGVTPLMGNGVTGTGSQRVTIASDNTAFSVNAVQSGTWTVQPGNTANSTPWLTTDTPATSGGLSFVAIPVSAATNNKTQVKGSAGQLYFISAQNLNASPRYLKVFNNTSAGVTMGTTACDFQFLIPGNTAGAGLVLDIPKGIAMGTGITIAVTGGISATDNTSISASEVTVLVGYK